MNNDTDQSAFGQNQPAIGGQQPPPVPPPLVVQPPTFPPAGAGAGGPLDDTHRQAIQVAMAAMKPLRKAAKTAAASAITILVVGGLSLVCCMLFFSLSGILLSTAICAIGVVELLGGGWMKKAQPHAATILALNQLTLLALITVYCVVQMFTASNELSKALLSDDVRALLPQMGSMKGSMDDLEGMVRFAYYVIYSVVIGVSVLFQGGLALYYYTRRKHIQSFNRSTPDWVRRLLAEMGI